MKNIIALFLICFSFMLSAQSSTNMMIDRQLGAEINMINQDINRANAPALSENQLAKLKVVLKDKATALTKIKMELSTKEEIQTANVKVNKDYESKIYDILDEKQVIALKQSTRRNKSKRVKKKQ